jgi:Thiol-disulfide isomerase and thioredoxins
MKKNILLILSIAISFTMINAQKNVVINVLDKTKGETKLTIQDWSVIRTMGFVETKHITAKESTSDSTFVFVIETPDRQNIVIANLHKERNQKQLLITAGDTLTAVIDFRKDDKNRFEIIFSGKNEENYNTYYDLNQKFNSNEIMKLAESVESLEKYIQIIDSAYVVNTKRINETLKPSLLRDIMLNEEKVRVFKYLEYRKRVTQEELTKSDFLIFKKRFFPEEKIVLNNPIYMKSSEYTFGMGFLEDFLCQGINAENLLMAETDTIEKYFARELKDYLLVINFFSATNRYKKDKELNNNDVDNWYNDYCFSEKIKNDHYKKFIQFSYDRFKILNNPFPENVLKEKIIQLSDSSVYTVGSFLEKHKGMQLIIDNWATWCGPCIHEIQIGKEGVKKLKEVGNEFIYISIDEIHDFNKAKAKAIELGIIDNAYFLTGGFKSEYAKYLNISSIPRFIMIDVNGNVKNFNMMPFPSGIRFFSEYKK